MREERERKREGGRDGGREGGESERENMTIFFKCCTETAKLRIKD